MKKVELSAKRYRSEEALRGYSPEKRRCYFEGERILRYFPVYTKLQCDYECMINDTLNTCDCVKYSMLRDHNTSICEIKRAYCYFDAMNEWPIYNTTDKKSIPCDCYPTCNDIKYFVESEFDSVYDRESARK